MKFILWLHGLFGEPRGADDQPLVQRTRVHHKTRGSGVFHSAKPEVIVEEFEQTSKPSPLLTNLLSKREKR